MISFSVLSKADNMKPSGLTLKLIHRDSIESNNLTRIEKFQKIIHRSKLRANSLMSSTAENPTDLRAPFSYESSSY
ncbi:hypothetical protein MKW92_041319, partial [Papaver armeniacum]